MSIPIKAIQAYRRREWLVWQINSVGCMFCGGAIALMAPALIREIYLDAPCIRVDKSALFLDSTDVAFAEDDARIAVEAAREAERVAAEDQEVA